MTQLFSRYAPISDRSVLHIYQVSRLRREFHGLPCGLKLTQLAGSTLALPLKNSDDDDINPLEEIDELSPFRAMKMSELYSNIHADTVTA